MKHFALKFNHGVEIGANLAYVGHYARTKDNYIRLIASEEIGHREELVAMLTQLGEKPSPIINMIFQFIGNIILKLCAVSPKFLLNIVAQSLEIFAVFSYRRLAKKYPEFADTLNEMADTEQEHENYFKNGELPKRLRPTGFFANAHYYYGSEEDILKD